MIWRSRLAACCKRASQAQMPSGIVIFPQRAAAGLSFKFALLPVFSLSH
jgi:hypothetical protein